MKLDLDAIERAAREATPGPWEPEARTNAYWCILAPQQPGYAAKNVADVSNRHADATHIANMDPATVLLMCKAIRAAKDWTQAQGVEQMHARLTALCEALAPFDAQPEASTTGAKK